MSIKKVSMSIKKFQCQKKNFNVNKKSFNVNKRIFNVNKKKFNVNKKNFDRCVAYARARFTNVTNVSFINTKRKQILSTFTELTNFLLFNKSWQSWRHQPSAHFGLVVNIMPMHSFILSGRFSAPLRES